MTSFRNSDRETNHTAEAESDARDCAENFLDEMCEMWRASRELSRDLLNDYQNGDAYHHENHTDKAYSLTEAAAILDELSDYEETDTGLWDGQQPRDAISTQAAYTYTYANAVYAKWVELVEELQGKLEDLRVSIEGNPPVCFYAEVLNGETWHRLRLSDEFQTREDAEAETHEDEGCRIAEGLPEDYDEEEAVSAAGEKFLRLYFVLDGMEDGEYGGMVGAARRESEAGDFTAALALADYIYETRAESDNDGRAGKPEHIRRAVK